MEELERVHAVIMDFNGEQAVIQIFREYKTAEEVAKILQKGSDGRGSPTRYIVKSFTLF